MRNSPAVTAVSKTWRHLAVAALVASSFTAPESRAAVLVDTFGPGNSTTGFTLGLFNNAQGASTSLALSFSTVSTVTVDSVLAAVSGTGSVSFGIMSDTSGLPSDSFLYSVVLTNPVANVSLSGLGWALGAGNYWLAAIAVPGFNGSWDTSSTAGTLATNTTIGLPGWHTTTNFLTPGARITTAVPEPEAYAMLLAGLGLLGFMARRRANTRAS